MKRQEEGKKCSGLPKYDNNILCINAKVGFWENLFSRLPALALFGEKQRPSMLFSNSAAQLCRLGGNIVKQVSYPRWKELFSVVP